MPNSIKSNTHNGEMINEDFNTEALLEHNRLRGLHGCPPLTLDNFLMESAQMWANKLAKEEQIYHSNSQTYGENLAFKKARNVVMNGEEMSQAWYEESEYHDYDKPHTSNTARFAQMIWKSCTRAGFGVAVSADGTKAYGVGRYLVSASHSGEDYECHENIPRILKDQPVLARPNSTKLGYADDPSMMDDEDMDNLFHGRYRNGSRSISRSDMYDDLDNHNNGDYGMGRSTSNSYYSDNKTHKQWPHRTRRYCTMIVHNDQMLYTN